MSTASAGSTSDGDRSGIAVGERRRGRRGGGAAGVVRYGHFTFDTKTPSAGAEWAASLAAQGYTASPANNSQDRVELQVFNEQFREMGKRRGLSKVDAKRKLRVATRNEVRDLVRMRSATSPGGLRLRCARPGGSLGSAAPGWSSNTTAPKIQSQGGHAAHSNRALWTWRWPRPLVIRLMATNKQHRVCCEWVYRRLGLIQFAL